jgi:hypothetical protein
VDHFGPINRNGEAVTSKATQGQDCCLSISWFRADTTSSGPALASANCMFSCEYHYRWCWPAVYLAGAITRHDP